MFMDGMFSSTGSQGLYKAPLSKGLLLILNGLSVMVFMLPQYQDMFVYDLQAIIRHQQVWRLLCGRLIFLDFKDSFCTSLIIYNFRIFERRFGTRKFASFLLGTWCVSALMDFLLAQAVLYLFEYEVEELPSGPLAAIFSLFVPFYQSIPGMPVIHLLGRLQITSKSLVYILGLQLLTSSPLMWFVALSGLISGIFYYSNVLWIQKLVFVPAWISYIGRYTLETIISSSQPTGETPLGMGATLDIQRQQRMDLMDQQLLLAQYDDVRRNNRPQQRGGLLRWTRLFPTLRHRERNRQPTQPQPQAQAQPTTQSPVLETSPVAEEQVALLVEMGFSRMDAQEALRATNNDINMATNFLLQH